MSFSCSKHISKQQCCQIAENKAYNSGDILIAPLSIFTKSSGKIAEFYFERMLRENMLKLLNLSKKWALVLSGNLYEKTKKSGKVAEFYKNVK
jgi:hypothetical protein